MDEPKYHDPFFGLTMFFIAVGIILIACMWWRAATYQGFDDVQVVGLKQEVGMWPAGR